MIMCYDVIKFEVRRRLFVVKRPGVNYSHNAHPFLIGTK